MSEAVIQVRPRPQVGTVTVKERKIPICCTCGYILHSAGVLCSYSCPEDGTYHDSRVLAVYKITEEFLRYEKQSVKSKVP